MTPKIIAHRGYAKKYPENTMNAFTKAVERGADGIELDVHFTKDKQVIVHHQYILGKTNNGEGYIFEKDAAYLRSLDCGSWFGPEFKQEQMPFLDEVLTALQNNIFFEIELKGFGKEFVAEVLNLVKKHNVLSQVKFTSYQYPLLSYLKEQEPTVSVGLIAQRIPEWMDYHTAREIIKSSLLEGKIDVLHCPIDLYDQQFAQELHSLGVQIHAGLCDTEEQLQKARLIEADELTTNELDLAIAVLKRE